MSSPDFIPTHPILSRYFSLNQKFQPAVAGGKNRRSLKFHLDLSLGYHGYLYQRSWQSSLISILIVDTFTKTKNVHMAVVLVEKSVGLILWGPWMSVQRFMALHASNSCCPSKVVDQPIDRQTDRLTLTFLESCVTPIVAKKGRNLRDGY